MERFTVARGPGWTRLEARLTCDADPAVERREDGRGVWLTFTDGDDFAVRLSIEGDPDACGDFWSRLESTSATAIEDDWPDDDDGEGW